MSQSWDIIYYRKADGTVPGADFLAACPVKVRARLYAVLDDVAEALRRYSGGGRWEAMHGNMAGYYEVRVSGPGQELFRVFCVLEYGSVEELTRRGLERSAIAVITGMRKPNRTAFSAAEYFGGTGTRR